MTPLITPTAAPSAPQTVASPAQVPLPDAGAFFALVFPPAQGATAGAESVDPDVEVETPEVTDVLLPEGEDPTTAAEAEADEAPPTTEGPDPAPVAGNAPPARAPVGAEQTAWQVAPAVAEQSQRHLARADGPPHGDASPTTAPTPAKNTLRRPVHDAPPAPTAPLAPAMAEPARPAPRPAQPAPVQALPGHVALPMPPARAHPAAMPDRPDPAPDPKVAAPVALATAPAPSTPMTSPRTALPPPEMRAIGLPRRDPAVERDQPPALAPLPGPSAPAPGSAPGLVAPTPPDLRHVAATVSQGIVSNGPGTTEIQLSPEELGRVRLVIATTDSGTSVTITAERPETAEFLRRHIDQMERACRDLGLADTQISFGKRHETAQDHAPAPAHSDLSDTEAPADPAAPIRRVIDLDRLDLRL